MKIIEAIHNILFSVTDLTDIVDDRIQYARAPFGTKWPLLHYFDVSYIQGYIMDYDRMIVQFSVWSKDKFEALQMKKVLLDNLTRFKDEIAISGGTVKINYSLLIDSGALPTEDNNLYGQFIRVDFRYRGNNLEG